MAVGTGGRNGHDGVQSAAYFEQLDRYCYIVRVSL
jgi:hypothetical protein